MKISLLGVIGLMTVGLFFSSGFVQAQGSINPVFNPTCWKKDDCIQTRKQFFSKKDQLLSPADQKNIESGWVENEGECTGTDWGKCLPGNKTTTEISFAGQTSFASIGDFIVIMYKFALTAAGIVAAIVIIWAGFQWTMSGGNSEVISSAQHKIVGAITGLFIAYGSYFILVNINPDLVNLRLPQVWMIRNQNIISSLCSAASSTGQFAPVPGSEAGQMPLAVIPDPPATIQYSLTFKDAKAGDNNARNFYCGKQFYVKNGGKNACLGDFCDNQDGKSSFCLQDTNNKYICKTGNVVGTITHKSLAKELFPSWLTEEWADPVVSSIYLNTVCDDGGYGYGMNVENSLIVKADEVNISDDKKTTTYALTLKRPITDIDNECTQYNGIRGKLRGFVLVMEMNEANDPIDEQHIIGLNGVDLGDKDFFVKNVKKIDSKFFISLNQLNSRIQINVEAANVKDIDSETGPEGRDVYYQRFGISR